MTPAQNKLIDKTLTWVGWGSITIFILMTVLAAYAYEWPLGLHWVGIVGVLSLWVRRFRKAG